MHIIAVFGHKGTLNGRKNAFCVAKQLRINPKHMQCTLQRIDSLGLLVALHPRAKYLGLLIEQINFNSCSSMHLRDPLISFTAEQVGN